MPGTIHGSSYGTARLFQQNASAQPLMLLAALLAIYVVLGMLYESYTQPVTILSTLPSAGVGALLALLATDMEFSLIAFLGILLLIGIVKKNAIMMVDFALDAERTLGLDPRAAIARACSLRFRPIMMTTCRCHCRRLAPRDRVRRWHRDAPPAGHLHRRRPGRQPVVHSVHHTGCLPVCASILDAATRIPEGKPALPMLDQGQAGQRMTHTVRGLVTPAPVPLLSACAVGPNYTQARDDTGAESFKEVGDWKPSEPADALSRGPWWEIFHDEVLNQLEAQVEISNQNVKAAVASYEEAQALLSEAHAGYWPTVSLNAARTRTVTGSPQGGGPTGGTSSFGAVFGRPQTTSSIGVRGDWTIDLWGEIRRTVESSRRELAGERRGAGQRKTVGAGFPGDGVLPASYAGSASDHPERHRQRAAGIPEDHRKPLPGRRRGKGRRRRARRPSC